MKTKIALTLVALMVGGAALAQTQGGSSGATTTRSNATNTGTAARGDVTRGNPDRQTRNRTKAPQNRDKVQNRDKAQEERDVANDPRDNTTATGTGINNANSAARDADRSSTSGGSEMRGSSGTTGATGTGANGMNNNGTTSTNEPARNGDLPLPRSGGMSGTGGTTDKSAVPPVR